ncbi:helix-turn-helix domain-containing protein [Ammoniphilus resinae]|uniref:AraC-like DNA-binding protein n=1 Tax=Ammoniphilus resinae TaxID=861532 RepID=A0ABS4GTV2_9BACL|nr:helix-turn-helix domain-containing protein [Ammoniphilus resinae]MBP1933295.1 AraC-like DNA-binding protein [Ammoniphilus resinae]
MRSKLLIGRNPILIQYMLPYIAILLIPLSIGWITYEQTVHMVKEEVVKSNMTLLEQSKEILDRRLEEVENFAHQLMSDSKVVSFQYLKDPYKGSNTYRIVETRERLKAYKTSSNFIFNYYILFKNSNLVLSSNSTYKLVDFYEHFIQPQSSDYDSWYEHYLGRFHHREYLPAQPFQFSGNPYSMVTYIHSLGYPNYFNGVLMVLIQNEEIKNLFSGLDTSNGGWAYIADEQGKIISFVSNNQQVAPINFNGQLEQGVIERTLNGQEYMITYTTSKQNQWRYVVGQPSHIVLEKVHYLKEITMNFMFIALIVGLAVAAVLAYQNSRPIKKLVSMITERYEGRYSLSESGGTYGFIQNTLATLFKSNEELRNKIKEQVPVLRGILIENLIKGGFKTEKEIENILEHVGMSVHGRRYVVCILDLGPFDIVLNEDILNAMDEKRVMIKEILSYYLDGFGFIHDIDQDKIAILVALDLDDDEKCRVHVNQLLGQISEEIRHTLIFHPFFAVGGIYDQWLDISLSFVEAREVLHMRSKGINETILWINDLPNTGESYYYPVDLETRLMNFARAGAKEETLKLVQELYRVNFVEKHLSRAMLLLFLSELWGSVVKLVDQVNVAQTWEELRPFITGLRESEDPQILFSNIEHALVVMCEEVNQRKKSRNVQLIDSIIEFIQSRYINPDLCLSTISEKFQISEVYLSQFFKEQTGINFSDYLERIRMDRSKELLASTNMSVYEIATEVGYLSSNTFGRAFKRINGLSASAYRRSLDNPR